MLLQIVIYTLVPSLALIVGGAIAAIWPPNKRVQSYFQHFAAGIVFAALAGEVLPDLTDTHPNPIFVILGFALGVLSMLAIRWFVGSKVESGSNEGDTGLILVVGIDLLVDGLLLGVGIALGEVNGLLIAIALTIEILFLGLSVAATLVGSGKRKGKVAGIVALLAIPVALGVLTGSFLFADAGHNTMIMILSFAAAALLFLVTEELLVEAHEVRETALSTSAFFAGFLLLYLLEILL